MSGWNRLSVALALAIVGSGCSGVDDPAAVRGDGGSPYVDEFARLLGEGASDGGARVDCVQDASPLAGLDISVRTVSGEGRYRPRNVGAIWIEDADGVWVKTLERWGERRAKWLSAFNAASAGDVTDAVTGATLAQHRVHEVRWDLTDLGGCRVSNGHYQMRLEMTDSSGTGETISIPFDKSEQPSELTPNDESVFRDMRMALE